jgi:hypothetical protein
MLFLRLNEKRPNLGDRLRSLPSSANAAETIARCVPIAGPCFRRPSGYVWATFPGSAWTARIDLCRRIAVTAERGEFAHLTPDPPRPILLNWVQSHEETKRNDEKSFACCSLRCCPHHCYCACSAASSTVADGASAAATRGDSRYSRRSSQLGLARWILPLAWRSLRLGSRDLSAAAARRVSLASRPVASNPARMGLGRGPMDLRAMAGG